MSSPLSGKAGRSAAIWTANYADDAYNRMTSGFDTGLKNQVGALENARGTIGGSLGSQIGAVNAGADQAIGRLGEAADLYRPAYDRGEAASGMYSNSLGLGGIAGNQAATDAFQAGPGYAFQRDQAADLAARKASSLGIAGSGNTLTALTTLGSNLANQEYGNWQNRLQGLGQTGMQAAGGIASALTGQAGVDTQRGQNLAGIYGQNAGNIANTYTNEASLYGQDAQNRANAVQWQAGQIIPAGQAGMMAGQQAAANRMNLGMQGLQLGSSLLGSFAGGGAGALGGLFGGSGAVSNGLGAMTGFSPFASNM